MTDGQFLCGCNPEDKQGYSGEGKRRDSGGYEVCPEHGERIYGWISVDESKPRYVDFGGGKPPRFVGPNTKPTWSVKETPDLRDNRDPEDVYVELKLRQASFSNGNVVVTP